MPACGSPTTMAILRGELCTGRPRARSWSASGPIRRRKTKVNDDHRREKTLFRRGFACGSIVVEEQVIHRFSSSRNPAPGPAGMISDEEKCKKMISVEDFGGFGECLSECSCSVRAPNNFP